MNLSCHKMMTSGAGDTLTITCFTCGMPSSKEWAQKISSRPVMPPRPFFPFLVTIQPPAGAVLKEDGTTFVCAFCHASLEAQWRNYERQPGTVPPANRKYSLYKFICAVCGVETYRKRVRTLPFQEFPFLTNQRPPGSLTLGNNPLAVVCLDCSETLWAQSAEYDRWGLPVHKRRFNWLARPPPDPDSLEATVARLPSGETQLPRCPPTEPVLKPKEPSVVHFDAPPVKVKVRNSKSDSNNSTGSDNEIPGRKTSLALLEQSSSGGVHPPVVTVAPMSSHSASLTAHRKDSLPAGYGSSLIPAAMGHPMFPRTTVFPPPTTYGPYPWTLDNSNTDHYSSYDAAAALQHHQQQQQSSSNASWPWIPPPASGLIPYAGYLPTPYTASRSYSVSEPFYNNSNSYYPPSPENCATTVTTSAGCSTYLTHLRPSSPRGQRTCSSSTTARNVIMFDREVNNSPPPPSVIPRKLSAPEVRQVKRPGPEVVPPKKSLSLNNSNKNGKSPPPSSRSGVTLPKKSYLNANVDQAAAASSTLSSFISVITEHPPATTTTTTTTATFKPKANAIRNHNNEKLMIAKKWKKAAMAEAAAAAAASKSPPQQDTEDQGPPPCKIARNTRRSCCSESEQPVDFSVKERAGSTSSLQSWPERSSGAPAEMVEDGFRGNDNDNDVIDLSRKGTTGHNNNNLGTSKKFMIAYLCQSEKEVEEMNDKVVETDGKESSAVDNKLADSSSSPVEPSGRRSVIVTLPKLSDRLEEEEAAEEEDAETEEGSEHAELLQVSSVESSSNAEAEQDTSMIDNKDAWNPSPKVDPVEDVDKPAGQSSVCSNENFKHHHSSAQADEKKRVTRNGAGLTHNNGPQLTRKDGPKCKEPADDDDEDLNKMDAHIIQDYVQKAVGEYKEEAKRANFRRKKFEADQEEFLGLLGLVTLQKKSEVELNKLISRSKHFTLPPLKLRPSTPPKVQLDEEFESKLREIAFDDPSLKKCDLMINQDEVTFLAQIGLQPASKSEKEKRETKWRIVLTERMMRAKRGENLTGGKKPWESEECVSKLLTSSSSSSCSSTSPKTTSSQLGALSVALPTNEGDREAGAGSADLLQIVTSSPSNSLPCSSATLVSVVQPVITYPKYIPSYATRSSRSRLSKITEEEEKPQESLQVEEKDTRILKVPVVNNNTGVTGTLVDSSKVNVGDEGEGSSEKATSGDGNKDRCRASFASLDEIIRVDALNCENFINQINNLIAPTPSTSKGPKGEGEKDEETWPPSAAEWRKMKKYLKTRQSQMKMIEDKIKKREKVVLSRLRGSMSSNTH